MGWESFSKLARWSPFEWRHLVLVPFMGCFYISWELCAYYFPPALVKTPFNFIIAYSVCVGISCGIFALIVEVITTFFRIIRFQNAVVPTPNTKIKFTNWNNGFAFGAYLLLTFATAVAASYLIQAPMRGFADASVSLPAYDLGRTVKAVMVQTLENVGLRDAAEKLEVRQLGDYVIVTAAEGVKEYKNAVERLEVSAFLVVCGYLLADALGLWWGEKKTFTLLVAVDSVVFGFHFFSHLVNHYGFVPPDFRNFNATMLQSFCGGLMGVALLVQCIVFAYVVSLPESVGQKTT
jgi:hypothetical protein